MGFLLGRESRNDPRLRQGKTTVSLGAIVSVTIVSDDMAAKVSVDAYVLDSLMRDLVGHDRSPSAYLVYLTLWRRTAGRRRKGAPMSHRELAEDTGLSKSAVQSALRLLVKRKLVASRRASRTAVPEHFVLKPWVR